MATKTNKTSTKKQSNSSQKGVKEETPVNVLAAYIPTLPLIDGEKRADYEAFQASCLQALKPANSVETVWLQDFIDYTWEAQRLKKMKSAVILMEKQDAVRRLITDYGGEDFTSGEAYPLAKKWSKGDSKVANYVDKLMRDHGLGESAVMAKAIESCLPTLECIDKLIGAYNYRRDAAHHELEKRRDVLAKRAKEFAENQIPEAEVIAVTETE